MIKYKEKKLLFCWLGQKKKEKKKEREREVHPKCISLHTTS